MLLRRDLRRLNMYLPVWGHQVWLARLRPDRAGYRKGARPSCLVAFWVPLTRMARKPGMENYTTATQFNPNPRLSIKTKQSSQSCGVLP